jgi:hypothetical protein
MRRSALVVFIGLIVAAGCTAESGRTPTQPETLTVPLRVESGGAPPVGALNTLGTPENHRTHLSGDNEVLPVPAGAPTPADSNAQGQAIIQISKTGDSFDYKLIVSNIENITQAHIHCGPAGTNGPIVVWLYPSPTSNAALSGGAGRHDGILAENTVISGAPGHVRPTTNPNCPGGVATFQDVLNRIREGNAYVNVHTNDGVGATNTGPGDFPGGEVRGQLGH